MRYITFSCRVLLLATMLFGFVMINHPPQGSSGVTEQVQTQADTINDHKKSSS